MSISGSSNNWIRTFAACVCCAGLVAVTGVGAAPCSAGVGPASAREVGSPSASSDSPAASGPATADAATSAARKPDNSWEGSLRLPEVMARLQDVLPESWEISGVQHGQAPRRWAGSSEGVLIRLENPSIVAYHPNGFEYHPFFKIWLCPTLWRGSMEDVRFLEESDWSVLLGQNHRMKVFYLSQGVNDWSDGPELLRKALDLTSLPITRSLRQRIQPEIMMKVFPKLAVTDNGHAGLLQRVVGLEMEGPLAYVEYATGTASDNGKTNGHVSTSRCAEPGVVWLMDRENQAIANLILHAYPEVQTVYLRRVCDEFASDRIIDRSDEPSKQSVKLSHSAE